MDAIIYLTPQPTVRWDHDLYALIIGLGHNQRLRWFMTQETVVRVRQVMAEAHVVPALEPRHDAAEWDRLAEYADAQADATVASN